MDDLIKPTAAKAPCAKRTAGGTAAGISSFHPKRARITGSEK
jgi:hypothetical protein